jgi:hypothetical protein
MKPRMVLLTSPSPILRWVGRNLDLILLSALVGVVYYLSVN